MKHTLAVIVALALVVTACAGDIKAPSGSPLKVDLKQVVATGNVEPVDGITSAGQPDAAAFKVFAENGYAAVVDLRTEGESRGLDEKAVVEGLGMDYVPVPIGRGGISFENAEVLDKLIASYDAPILIHCASANRVGALLALRASQQGVDDEAAIEIGKRGGLTRLETQVRETLEER
jgi:uncharacterized protein (TIGR01244 family)